MAKITHPSLFRFANFQPGLRKKVGNNREVMHVRCEHEDQIIGALHGHPVFTITRHTDGGGGEAIFDHCGYPTATTRNAMHGFMEASGLSGSVSFAGGMFKVSLFGDWRSTDKKRTSFGLSHEFGEVLSA